MPRVLIDGKYEIIRKMREGGFGYVYYGWDLTLDKPVAIKEVAPNLLGEQQYIDMFTDEALNTAKLSHANIVQVLDLRRTAEGRIFIIMEYIDGTDLRTALERCQTNKIFFPIEVGVYVIGEVCKALEYAHTARDRRTGLPLNIIHRDISPSNIMFSRNGEVKLIDFGIAKARTRTAKKTRTGILKGKVNYMSPEQLEGKVIDRRSDIFSLGIVFYEVLAGQKLFRGESDYSIMKEIVTARVDLEPLRVRQVPPRLMEIVQKALRKDLLSRYQSTNEMYVDLYNYQKTTSGELPQERLVKLLQIMTGEQPVEERKESTGAVLQQVSKDSEQVIATREIAYSEREYEEKEERLLEEPVTVGVAQETVVRGGPGERKQPLPVDTQATVVREGLKPPYRKSVRQFAPGRKTGLLIGAAVIVFLLVLDIGFRLTPIGKAIRGPAVSGVIIKSIPPGATVTIDGQRIDGVTPLPVDFLPGEHDLILSLPGFDDLMTHISYAKGKADQFSFAFRGKVEVSSLPSGAEVYCNGQKLPQTTPCQIVWPLDTTLALELAYGASRLLGATLNLETGNVQLPNQLNWSFEKTAPQRFKVTAVFTREITFASQPAGADIYLAGKTAPVGNTSNAPVIGLPYGQHKLTARLAGYQAQTILLEVAEATPSHYTFELKKVTASTPPSGVPSPLVSTKGKTTLVVRDQNGNPLSGAQLIALNLRSKERKPLGRTDGKGTLVCDLPGGRWKVSVFLASYQTESKEFDLIVGAGKSIYFTLRRQ